MSDTGLITVDSDFSVAETINKLVDEVRSSGLRVFARVDHAANAGDVGEELRPTELVIFGHPQGGTPLMQDRQTAGIDLPVKALAWEDAGGQVFLTYNDALWLSRRHDLGEQSADAVSAIKDGLAILARAATRAS